MVNKVVAVATAKALIERSNLEHLKDSDLKNSSWAKSLFKRMGFLKRAAATGRPDIPEGTKKEAEIIFLHQIVDLDEEKNTPPSLIMNFDQTPLKYVPVTSQSLAEKGSKHAGISGMTYRKSHTATVSSQYN